jgi:very-short-patch-repair endonuclease
VFALGHDALDLRGRLTAALLYAGPGAMLSHQTAAYWWQLLPTQPSLSHVATPRNRASARGVRVHRQRDLPRIRHRGLPVTTVERTLLDLAATLPFAALRRALAEADFRNRLDPTAVTAELGRGRPGAAALRKALSLHCPELAQTRSVLEEKFLALCERERLPPPEINGQVEGLMVDGVWRQARLVVELDGLEAHSSPTQLDRDHKRDLRLRAAGYRVSRYSWNQLANEPAAVAADLRRALSS